MNKDIAGLLAVAILITVFILFVIWLVVKNRRAKNKINEMEYFDEKDKILKDFYDLSRDERIDKFNDLTRGGRGKRRVDQ